MAASDATGAPARAVVRVDRSVVLEKVEKALGQIRAKPGADLLLAYKLRHRDLLVTASLCQLALTWASSGSGCLRTWWAGNEHLDKELGRLTASDYGLVAALAATDVVDLHGRVSLLDATRPYVNDAIGKMARRGVDDKAELGKGRASLLILREAAHGRDIPDLLYERVNGVVQPRSIKTFRLVADKMLRLRFGEHPPNVPVLETMAQQDTLAVLLRELVWNADEWGQRLPDGSTVPRNVLMLRAEWHDGGTADLAHEKKQPSNNKKWNDADVHEPRILRWLEDVSGHAPSVMELSILDAGPGITARRLRGETDVDAAVELEALVDCLRRGYTSATHRPGRGEGLDAALAALTEMRGLIRIRSGRLDVYCDTAETPYDGTPVLRDWQSGSTAATVREPVVGTLVSMLVPLTGLAADA
jgi:hypothetical protein